MSYNKHKKKLAIISTHPIQYNAPLFELLTARKIIELKVFYTWGESVLKNKYDPGFSKIIEWDIPLLKGYDHIFLENTAKNKGSHHFFGIINPDIINAIKKYNADAILVYGWSHKSHLDVLRYFKNKIPVFFRGDSTLLDDTSFFVTLRKIIFLRWIYQFVDAAFYVGKNNYDYFQKYGLKRSQLVFAPHAVDNARFICDTQECKFSAANYRMQLDISKDHFVFLFAGKLESKKDPELFLKAFTAAAFPENVHVVIVGNGQLEKGLKTRFGNFRTVHFLDFQNQQKMPAVYEMADVFVLPSKGPGETWGLAVNEAMANGKPIILSDKCGCAADLVENKVNGYVFNAMNLNDLQEKLKIMYKNRGVLHLMKKHSRNKIMQFSLDKVASSIENTMIEKTVFQDENCMSK